MGNGHPTSAVITTKEIARDFLAKRPDLEGEVSVSRVNFCLLQYPQTAMLCNVLTKYVRTNLKSYSVEMCCVYMYIGMCV